MTTKYLTTVFFCLGVAVVPLSLFCFHPIHTLQHWVGGHAGCTHVSDGIHVDRVDVATGTRICCADVPNGLYTAAEIAEIESRIPDSSLSSKTPPVLGPVENDVLTIIIDFKRDDRITTDVLGNQVGAFDIEQFGFDKNDFPMLTNALLNEVIEDFSDELAGVLKQNGGRLNIDFIIGDIGVAPPGISEFYFVQVGSRIGPDLGLLGIAAGGTVRNINGEGPNLGIEVGDVIATVYPDSIVTLDGLTPANALTSGNLEFTTNAIVGTLSHEIGHALSLSHVAVANSVQPTTSAAPIMATGGAFGLTNQGRIDDREFSISGFFPVVLSTLSPRFHVRQLACATGALAGLDGKNRLYFTGLNGSNFLNESNWNDEPDGSGSSPLPNSILPSAVLLDFDFVIDGASTVSSEGIIIGNRAAGSVALLHGSQLVLTGSAGSPGNPGSPPSGGPLEFNNSSSLTLVNSEISVFHELFLGGEGEFVNGGLASSTYIQFLESATLSITGTAVTASEGIDFFGSFESILDATFSSSTDEGVLTINGIDSVVQMTDTSVTTGSFESIDVANAGTLVLMGNSEITLDEMQDRARLELFDNSMAFVESSLSGVGNNDSTVTLFSLTSLLAFPSTNLSPSIDRRDFVVDGTTGLSYNEDPLAWNISDWDGLSNITLQLRGEVLIGDVNQDGDLNLLDVGPFVDLIQSGAFQAEADINQDGVVDLLDIRGFVAIVTQS